MKGENPEAPPAMARTGWFCRIFLAGWLFAASASAIAVDLDRAASLVREGKYQEAYDLLRPEREAQSGDAEFNYLLGRAALGSGRAEEAQALLEQSLATRPGDVEAHLALGRALFAQDKFGEARLEFETVLQFQNLPLDLLTQVETYDQAAEQYLDGERLTRFGYAETGFGGYRTNSTRVSTGGDQDSTFFNARIGGGIDYLHDNGYAMDANLDYRFRHHDDSGVRNDSDLRWRLAGSRTLGDDNWAAGFRGRVRDVNLGERTWRRRQAARRRHCRACAPRLADRLRSARRVVEVRPCRPGTRPAAQRPRRAPQQCRM